MKSGERKDFMTEKEQIEREVQEGLCEFMHVHEEIVEKVEKVMPDEQQLLDLSEFFKVFGDSTRIKILYVLSQSEMCVCDIASILQMGQSAISHQLRVLKQMRLVKFRRDGKTVFYSLSDTHIQTILAQGMEHICE
jgi:ArsR family transcriptional regulator